jgi:chromosome segregation ATPase
MNTNPTVSPSTIRTIKSEPGRDNISYFKTHLSEQKEEYKQEIARLQKTHDEQTYKLCSELEKSSSLLHQYKLELDSMRIILNKKVKTDNNDLSATQDLQTKNTELTTENTKLKKDLSLLTTKYQTLFNEMQDARQYVMKIISNLD